ncbi:uncharacterized protein LOC127837122 isoform X2 [Dreissena polymorpha]|uniref:uncharacterized protein LOC127837122 isoform X2 n=1 Tax=Dreissena polymorpha TaxID=45954 RepID=UPI0022643976|nr:uncharacterized protein LOC127837122 isoform X2 [Dreissena polymorpha]
MDCVKRYQYIEMSNNNLSDGSDQISLKSNCTANQLPTPSVPSASVQRSDGKAFDAGPSLPGEDAEHGDEGLPCAPNMLEISKGTHDEIIQFAENTEKETRGVEGGVINDEEAFISLKERRGEDESKHSRIIGKGSFGTVELLHVGTKEIVRKKVQRNQFKTTEAKLPCSLKHLNIVLCLGLICKETTVEIFFEHAGINLCEHMKRYSKLQNATNREQQYAINLNLFKQLISALKYLHTCGHRHLDVKPANICISQDGSDLLKLIDWGSAKMRYEVNDFTGMTPQYRAPEIDRYLHQGCKDEEIVGMADMFSSGLVWMYMLDLKHFLKGDGDAAKAGKNFLAWLVLNGRFIPIKFQQLNRKLGVQLLKNNPSERWTSSQAWDALKENELQEMTPKERRENPTTSSDSTASSVAMNTAHIHVKNETNPRETMPLKVEDLHEYRATHLPAKFTNPRHDPDNGTDLSSIKVANPEGWEPTHIAVSFSTSVKIDVELALRDQAVGQRAVQEGNEHGLLTGN